MPIANAIVWQCRRTADLVEELCGDAAVAAEVRARTGLMPDAYFSASKIRWLLDNVAGAREKAEAGELLFGTVDTYLVWVLTGGLVHATDETNASRTMLYNIHERRWDPWLLELFGVPASMLPEVRPSSGSFGETSFPGLPAGIPITGVAGDQQAALFGQCCFEAGQAKNTYGTGCFMLLHTGHEAVESKNSLVTTIVASPPNTEGCEYALEGSVFVGGAVVQWLRDEVGIIRSAAETEYLATSIEDTGGVYIVPAFTGLGAPWWAPDARGSIFGITRGTGQAQLVRAALEAIAYQVSDLAVAMEADAGKPIEVLNVDGGASANNFLIQFQSDILERTLHRPQNRETTAMGAAYLAGLATGFWSGIDELRSLRSSDDVFTPKMDAEKRAELLDGWHEAIRRTI
jgi:glycerol kinase